MEKRPYFRSLRGRLTNRALLLGLLPILIIGGISFYGFQQLARNATVQLQSSESELLESLVGANLTVAARRTVEQLDNFLLERISDVIAWASAPTVTDAAKKAATEHQTQGLTELSVSHVESRFKDRKSLNVSPVATSYLLQQVQNSQHFGEVFFTDKHGFNAALTNPTSDFVQRDENWWRAAWLNGISIGQIKYDDSARIWSVDISVRIDDPEAGISLGVMKAVLGVSLIQEVADSQANTIEGGSITIINDAGLLVAETESDHQRERIMNESVNLRTANVDELDTVFGNSRSGFILADSDVIGFARSAGPELYGSVVARFRGFSYTAIVRQPNEIALRPIQGLKSIQSEIITSQKWMVYILAGAVILVVLFAVGLSNSLSRSITQPLNELRDLADEVSKGNTERSIKVSSDDEIMDVGVAFERMRTSIAILIERMKNYKNRSAS